MSKIAFIGLGAMGGAMAPNLVKAGRAVTAFDLSPAAIQKAAAAGLAIGASPGETVADAEVVITMLPAGQHVREVYAEVLAKAPAAALLIDCSTIDVETARAVAAQAKAQGFRFADAPVSGGTAAAEGGTLTFMVGCHEADFAAVEETLTPMAKAVIRAGDHGAGQAAKICNNMLLGISMIGTCEALVLAEKLGLSAERFFEIASKSSGQCWSLTSYCPAPGVGPPSPADRDFEGGFAVAMMLKDLRLSQEAADHAGAQTPMGAKAKGLYEQLDAAGYGRKDFSGIIRMLRGEIDGL